MKIALFDAIMKLKDASLEAVRAARPKRNRLDPETRKGLDDALAAFRRGDYTEIKDDDVEDTE